jgi:hypothetical protein
MRQTLSRRMAVAVLAAALPTVALADLTRTTTLQANTTLNLETGATGSSGGDLLWDGTTLIPQGAAKAVNIGVVGDGSGNGSASRHSGRSGNHYCDLQRRGQRRLQHPGGAPLPELPRTTGRG